MTSRGDFVEFVREDDRRKRDDAKIQSLQAQIDEIRHLTREILSRQLRLEEQLKANEQSWAQHRIALEQHRHEVSQAAQARQVEETRVRQQISDLNARIDDATRPVRTLQAHVAELVETVRRQREDTGHDTKRYDDLRTLIDHLTAHTERQIAVSQSLRDSIDALRTEVDRQQRDLLRTDDGVRIVEQEFKRRIAEIVQQTENLSVRLTEELGGIDALQAQIDNLRDDVKLFAPQFETLHEGQQRLEGEIARFHAQALERDEITTERLEEIRQQFDVRLRDMESVDDQRHERSTQRADALEEMDRELSYRITMLEIKLEELQQTDQRLRREMWYLNEQRARLRFEQAQQELDAIVSARRDVEKHAALERQPGNGTE